jgi:hypothetical protein
MLEGTEFITFCDMWKRSFRALPPRSTTPPVEGAPASTTPPVKGAPASTTPPVKGAPASTTPPVEGAPASTTPPVEGVPAPITDPTPSLFSAWSASPENIDISHNPTSGINPSSSTNNPWIVDEQDIRDSNDARAGKLQDNSKSLAKASQYLLISLQVRFLG